MDEDPDFGSSVSSSTSQASEHIVDMSEDAPPEVTIVWKELTVVSFSRTQFAALWPLRPLSLRSSCLCLCADHKGQVGREAKDTTEEGQWLR